MRFLLLLSIVTLVSCGHKSTSIKYGSTTVSHLIRLKGNPLAEEAVPTTNEKILRFSNDEKYQTDGKVITVGFKSPDEEEKPLIHWRHLFKNCRTFEKKISPDEIELGCPSAGRSVVYYSGSEFISRVVEYEKQ